MSDENQNTFAFDDNFDDLLEHLPALTSEEQRAQAAYKEHLWALVMVTERRLTNAGYEQPEAYKLSTMIIAEIAHYQGGRSQYLPRGDKLRQELRDIHMFRLWHDKSWPVDKIHKGYCPELNQIQVYKILRTKRREYLAKIQPKLI
ncbi:Mor transcription activator family protein [Neptunicella sp. SCSIO 80796]|uniref:Mor transcription activator family protein n=1 Tax=Neptunicella plasticusilytica TaxID=3117012 RepID=UPI003A4D38CF